VLYDMNCVACHSNGKTIGASVSMNDPLYNSLIPRDTMRKVTAEGLPGTLMPGFGKSAGGDLTDEQIDLLVDGIYAQARSKSAAPGELPPYAAALGDATRGAAAFNSYCAKCHGADGKGGNAGPVVEQDYLRLVSDQYLRTVVIVGRSDLGMPNHREYQPGKPMSPEEISDVVAWLVSHRQGPAPAQVATTTNNAAAMQSPNSNQQ
jgi:mono/diheme cytochrome c family protein